MIQGKTAKSATLRLNANELLLLQNGIQARIQRVEDTAASAATEAHSAALELRQLNDLQQKLSEFAAGRGWL